MREFRVGEIVEINNELFQVKHVEPENLELVSMETSLVLPCCDTDYGSHFVTTLSYLKKSLNSERVQDAKRIIENSGHSIEYVGDGMYVVDRSSAKVRYCHAGKLLELAEEVNKANERRRIEREEKAEKKKRKVVQSEKKQSRSTPSRTTVEKTTKKNSVPLKKEVKKTQKKVVKKNGNNNKKS